MNVPFVVPFGSLKAPHLGCVFPLNWPTSPTTLMRRGVSP